MRKILVIAQFFLIFIIGMVIASPAGASDYYNWSLASGEGWVDDTNNWTEGIVPGDSNNDDYAYVQTAGTLKVNADHLFAGTVKQFRVGGDDGTGTVIQSGGAVTLYENVVIGYDGTTTGTSTYTMTGGSITQTGTSKTVAIGGKGSNGELLVSGGTSDTDTTSITFTDSNGLRLGYSSTGGSGIVSLTDYAYFKIGKYFRIGMGTSVSGTLTMSGNSYAELTSTATDTSYIGREKGSTGTLSMSGNAEANFNTSGKLYVGEGTGSSESQRATGIVNLSGNAIFAANKVYLGRGNYAQGTLSISDSASYTSDGDTAVGWEGDANVAEMNVTGGTVDIDGQLCIGRSLSTGTVTLSGTASIDVYNYVRLGDNGGTATFNLDGGTLACDQILSEAGDETNGTTIGTFNFNGGVLQANGENADLISLDDTYTSLTINVKAGGAIVDSNGFSIGILDALLEDSSSTGGGLTKTGDGTLTLGGANTYTGDTTVEAGTLSITGNTMLSDSGDLSLASGTVVDLAFTGNSEEVNALYIGGVLQSSGTWGATGSGADNIDDTHFSGTGTIMVAVPEPTSIMLLVVMVGIGLFCRAKR